MSSHRIVSLITASFVILIAYTASPALAFSPIGFAYAAPPDYALSPQAAIELQAVLRVESPSSESVLNATLRSIDIRTALEDTARLRGDLG